MKKATLFLLLIAGLFYGNLFAQIRKVPSNVTDSFNAKYPGAQKVEWKAEISDYKVDFVLNGAEMETEYSSKGAWKETDTKMKFDAVPQTVKDGFKKSKFSDWKPGSVTFIEKKGKPSQYKIYAEKSSLVQKKYLYFNEQGQLLKDTY